MRRLFYVFRSVILAISVLCYHLLFSQQPPGESRSTSFLTYVYQINPDQAELILKKGMEVIDDSFLKNLMYTYPTDSTPAVAFEYGSYLHVFASGNELAFEFLSVSNIELRVLNNGADLNLLAFDLEGNEVNEATIQLNDRKLKYDTESNAYRIKKFSGKGVVRVEHEGVVSYVELEREIRYSKLRRTLGSIIYSVPLKYVTIPTKLILRSPYDLYKSVRRRYPQGIFYYTSKPFVDIVRTISYGESQGFIRPIACIFDKYYCKDRKYDGFIAFNKPKYRPGDTVRMKAYVLNHKAQLFNKAVELRTSTQWWYSQGNSTPAGTMEPYQPGFYEHSFILHDSLNMKLDNEYKLFLVHNEESLIHGSFYYEDYELDKTIFELQLSESELAIGDTVELIVEGKDANGLHVKDASVEIVIKPAAIHALRSDSLYVADEVWSTSRTLEPVGETRIEVPSEVFYDADMEYDVIATFTTADFEQDTKVKTLSYRMPTPELTHRFKDDSIVFELTTGAGGDSSISHKATLVELDAHEKVMDSTNVILPHTRKVNPLVKWYEIKTPTARKDISVVQEPSNVQVFVERDADSLHIQLANPKQLNVRYFLYKGNKEQRRGTGSDWQLHLKAASKKDYHLAIQYVWAGDAYEQNYAISLSTSQLKLITNTPSLVYPGKKVDIQVMVEDQYGNPVADADITSYGIKSQFERFLPPSLPDFSEEPKSRRLINNFSIQDNHPMSHSFQKNLDWQKWNAIMTLDSISYFQFIYPNNGYYNQHFEATDSVTQFAPYVMENGKLVPAHIIYLDNVPIYFSMTDHEQQFSFRARPGYHQVRLRTKNHEIRVDSVFLEQYQKTIMSVDLRSQNNSRVRITEKPSHLTTTEQWLANDYMVTIESAFSKDHYIRQNDRLFWSSRKKYLPTIGPLKPNARATYVVDKEFERTFKYEPRYSYSFYEELVKMRSQEEKTYQFPYAVHQSLYDEVWTEEHIQQHLAASKAGRQTRYQYFDYPKESRPGNGALALWNGTPSEIQVKNYVLFKDGDGSFIQVYGGQESTLYDLSIGSYHLFTLLSNNDFIEKRALTLRPNSTLYIRLDSTDIRHSDSVSRYINEMISQEVGQVFYSDREKYRNHSRIRSIYHGNRPRGSLSGNIVQGRLTDESSGEPLPGVNVLIKGTTTGTQTDLDGYYRLSVARGETLVFSYVGFDTQEIPVGVRSNIDIEMGGAMELQEVVVTAMGIERSGNALGYSVRSIEGDQGLGMVLHSKAPGVSITSSDGLRGPKVVIRGVSSLNASDKPLIVIDGIVFSGTMDMLQSDIESLKVLNGTAATALYGEQAVNGVVLISLKKGAKARQLLQSQALDLGAFPDISEANSLRRNFSDYAFWQPRATTDKNGIASINVTFPDDITTWKTHFLAIKGNKQSGETFHDIRSFKPILASLSVPRFLVEGDSSEVLGRVLNYTQDTLQVHTAFSAQTQQIQFDILMGSSHIDSLMVTPTSADTLEVKYTLRTGTGYEDGELREIPVYQKGTLEAKGVFKVLGSKDRYTLSADSMQGAFTLHVKGNLLEVLIDELQNVQHYPFACNEQKASKLLALIYEKRIRRALKEDFQHDKKIEELIKKLLAHQNEENQWGWWPEGRSVNWITLHVLKALFEAKKEGFEVAYDTEFIVNELIKELHSQNSKDLDVLSLLQIMDIKLDYPAYLTGMDTLSLSLEDQFQLIRLKQQAGMTAYHLDSLWKHKKETLFEGMCWGSKHRSVYRNSILKTVLAYQILDHKGGYDTEKEAIINYLLSNRKRGYWRNTYESIRILEAILPELTEGIADVTKEPKLRLTGDTTIVLKDFPHQQRLNLTDSITFSNEGLGPVFMTAYQKVFNPAPEKVSKDFTVTTKLSSPVLQKGKEVTLSARVTTTEAAEYVMVEVPIPAGTTYAEKPRARGHEVHREYFRDRVAIFYQDLPSGTHEVRITLLPRYSGTYTLNPAKAELMYFPTFYGREELKVVKVE